jgi:hypothetical protein
VWRNEPLHSQVNSYFGSWTPDGPPKLQRTIIRVKIHWIDEFLISLESSWNLDVWNGLSWPFGHFKHFKPHFNRRFADKVMGPQSCKSPNFGNLRTKCHLGVGPVAKHRIYYKGESGGFPQVQAMVSLMSPRSFVVRLNTKSVPTMH